MYTLNSWLWQLKTHGHNATWRFFLRYLYGIRSKFKQFRTVYCKKFVIWVYIVYECTCSLLCDWSLLLCGIMPINVLTGYVNQCAGIAKCNCWMLLCLWVTLSLTCSKSVFSDMSSKCPVKNVVFYVIMRGSF